jgi:putative copper resistance protein D
VTGADASLFVRVTPEWLELVSLSSVTGVLVCLLWVVEPEPGDGTAVRESVLGGLRRLLGWGVVALLLSSVLGLLVRSAGMSGYPLIRVFAVLPTVVLRTHFGHVWVLRIVAIVALSVSIVAAERYRRSRSSRYAMLGWALIVSALDSGSGHASDAGDFSVPELMDWLHLVAAMVWGGSLVVLSTAILPRMCNQGDRAARSIAGIAKRLSRIAGLAVAFVAVTAVYQEWAYGGSVEGLPGSAYGRIIILKVVLFFLLLLLGAWNRYVSVPRLQERAGFETATPRIPGRVVEAARSRFAAGRTGPSVAARFRRTVAFEAILFAAVLLCAALLRHEMPARHGASRDRHALAGWDGACPRPASVIEEDGASVLVE